MHLTPRPESRILSFRGLFEGWTPHCCGTIVGVAAALERFYKPELDAAHNPRLQANRPASLTVF
jgi:hypothetical protein